MKAVSVPEINRAMSEKLEVEYPFPVKLAESKDIFVETFVFVVSPELVTLTSPCQRALVTTEAALTGMVAMTIKAIVPIIPNIFFMLAQRVTDYIRKVYSGYLIK